MILDKVVTWYQKKIGTYDKEPWEKTVEQKILAGFSSVTLKTAKLKTELIDVDLVRGSTFPKAKPKQSLITVIRLAVLRYLFLPLYAQWWVKQTSPNAFGLLFFLYVSQMINWAFYTLNVGRVVDTTELSGNASFALKANINATIANKANVVVATEDKAEGEHIVSLADLLIPMVLSLTLSLIHSQIVATSIAQSGVKCKRRRFSNTSQNGRPAKLRRRKKIVKPRSHELESSTSTTLSAAQQPMKMFLRNANSQIDISPNCDGDYPLRKRRNVNWNTPLHKFAASQLKAGKTPNLTTDETEEEDDEGEIKSSPASPSNLSNYNECTTSATEWLGITTNSDECIYSSEYDNSDDYKTNQYSDRNDSDLDFTPTTILNPHGTSDRISCTVWDQREAKKAQMSVLEISSAIIENVESMPETNDYIYIGIFFSCLLALIPCFCRLCEVTMDSEKSTEINYFDLPMVLWEKASFSFTAIFHFAFGHSRWERAVLVIGFVQRLCLTLILFMIFSVAERTFKQRFLYAKLFSHLTSSRRARKSNLPHFRLNKVRNIKTWLCVRSYLKKRGPQRSVDIIVSTAFIATLLLLAFLSVEWLKDSVQLHSQLNLEALMWSTTIGIFLLRFMTLGNKIHHKYRSVSVLITEQINLYLQIEKKPKKKEELMVSNSVLKLAADLLKELETPFKISGLSANPYIFTTIKVVILSALSGVLSEMLGFKLKLHKIKIK